MIAAAMKELEEHPEPPPPARPPTTPVEETTPQHLLPHTDLGNAERLVARHGADLRYCHAWKGWLIWDGLRWKPDDSGAIMRRIAETVRSIYAEASQVDSKDGRKAKIKWAQSSESRRAMTAMEELGRNLKGIPVAVEDLDADHYKMTCSNGTVQLITGELLKPDRTDLITRMAPTQYNPEADTASWVEFIGQLMLGRKNLVDYLQRAVGYSLTGDIGEKVLFLCHGGGNNGKTTFLETLRTTLGDYAGQVLVESLMVQKQVNSGAPSPEIAELRGLRFVTSSESEEGSRLAEAKVKYLTGMQRVRARRLHENGWEFRPTWKLWIDCNHLPNIRGTDKAIWNRIRRIPFELTLEPNQVDYDLPAKLARDLPGILNWAVQGCLAWKTHGLVAPPEIYIATEAYHSSMDVLGRFLEEATEPSLPTREIKARTLYAIYSKWCQASGEYPTSERVFGERMSDRGIAKRHAHTGSVYRGISIKEDSFTDSEGVRSSSMVTGDRW